MGNAKRPEWFKMHDIIAPTVEYIPDDITGQGFKAAMKYYTKGEEPDMNRLNPAAISIYCMVKRWIDEAVVDCEKKSEAARRSINARWHPEGDTTVYDRIHANTDKEPEEESEKERDTEKEEGITICTEPSKLDSVQQPSPTVFRLILVDRTTYGVNQSEINEYSKLYPSVDVEQEFRNMIGWLEANPRKRKTRSGMSAFITHWLSDKQDNKPIARHNPLFD